MEIWWNRYYTRIIGDPFVGESLYNTKFWLIHSTSHDYGWNINRARTVRTTFVYWSKWNEKPLVLTLPLGRHNYISEATVALTLYWMCWKILNKKKRDEEKWKMRTLFKLASFVIKISSRRIYIKYFVRGRGAYKRDFSFARTNFIALHSVILSGLCEFLLYIFLSFSFYERRFCSTSLRLAEVSYVFFFLLIQIGGIRLFLSFHGARCALQ